MKSYFVIFKPRAFNFMTNTFLSSFSDVFISILAILSQTFCFGYHVRLVRLVHWTNFTSEMVFLVYQCILLKIVLSILLRLAKKRHFMSNFCGNHMYRCQKIHFYDIASVSGLVFLSS